MSFNEALTDEERRWLNAMPVWTRVSGKEIERKFDAIADALDLVALLANFADGKK